MITYDDLKFWLNYRKSYLEAQLAGKTICYSSAGDIAQ